MSKEKVELTPEEKVARRARKIKKAVFTLSYFKATPQEVEAAKKTNASDSIKKLSALRERIARLEELAKG